MRPIWRRMAANQAPHGPKGDFAVAARLRPRLSPCERPISPWLTPGAPRPRFPIFPTCCFGRFAILTPPQSCGAPDESVRPTSP